MNEELSHFLTDLREQILYLQELGIDSVQAELPEFHFQTSAKNVPLPINVTEVFEPKYEIPDISIIPKTEVKPSEDRIEATRNGSRLSNLPKLSNFSAPKNFETRLKENSENMPRKPLETSPAETLFGDISQTLPDSNETLEAIHAEIGKDCTRCTLCENRKQVVNSTGNINAELMFIGEAPGADEDAQGKPFVGRAGQLLTKIIEAIGIKREDVFIGNINRCRPPQNRQPLPGEVVQCKPFLLREIAVVRPRVIVVLGNTACQNLLDTKVGITKLRGNFQDYFGVKVMPTFHPAYLLRDPSKKRETWEDMKKVRDYLNSSD